MVLKRGNFPSVDKYLTDVKSSFLWGALIDGIIRYKSRGVWLIKDFLPYVIFLKRISCRYHDRYLSISSSKRLSGRARNRLEAQTRKAVYVILRNITITTEG